MTGDQNPSVHSIVGLRTQGLKCLWRKYGLAYIVLKEKLKVLKARMKMWNLEMFGDLNRQGKEIALKLEGLDRNAEEEGESRRPSLQEKPTI